MWHFSQPSLLYLLHLLACLLLIYNSQRLLAKLRLEVVSGLTLFSDGDGECVRSEMGEDHSLMQVFKVKSEYVASFLHE